MLFWGDIAVLFEARDVPLVQYDVLATLCSHGIRILLPRRRARGSELPQPALCGNHIMRTSMAFFKMPELMYDAADELDRHRAEL